MRNREKINLPIRMVKNPVGETKTIQRIKQAADIRVMIKIKGENEADLIILDLHPNENDQKQHLQLNVENAVDQTTREAKVTAVEKIETTEKREVEAEVTAKNDNLNDLKPIATITATTMTTKKEIIEEMVNHPRLPREDERTKTTTK